MTANKIHPPIREPETIQAIDPFRLMVENIRDYAIFLLNPDGQIKTWNLGAQRLKGFEPAEIIGKDFSIFYSQSEIKKNKPMKLLQIAAEEGRAEDEGWRVKKDGTRFWAWVVITALRDQLGNLIGFAKITRDLTERRRWELDLEKKVEERTKELKQSNRDLEQFAYVSSHDLQEPLRVIKLYVDLINRKMKGKVDADLAKYLEYISDSAARAQTLIQELLEYSRIGKKQEIFGDVDLDKVVKKVLKNLRRPIQEKSVVIECDALPIIKGYEFLLVRLFENLLSNSLKYTEKQPQLQITCKATKSAYTLTISDNGIGIDPQFHETIFEVFKRLHSMEQFPGTGIGLAMCKKIVELHEGRIWVESSKGKGAAFKFTLPISKEETDFAIPRGVHGCSIN